MIQHYPATHFAVLVSPERQPLPSIITNALSLLCLPHAPLVISPVHTYLRYLRATDARARVCSLQRHAKQWSSSHFDGGPDTILLLTYRYNFKCHRGTRKAYGVGARRLTPMYAPAGSHQEYHDWRLPISERSDLRIDVFSGLCS